MILERLYNIWLWLANITTNFKELRISRLILAATTPEVVSRHRHFILIINPPLLRQIIIHDGNGFSLVNGIG